MNIQIDPIQRHPDFIDTLASWHHLEWQHLNPADYTLQDRIDEYQQCLQSNQLPQLYVAHNNFEPYGSVRLIEHDMEIHLEWSPWMASLYVHPEYRQQGIATALIEYLCTQAASINFETLYLYTEHHETLYKRLGWKEMIREHYYDQDVCIMCYELTNPAK